MAPAPQARVDYGLDAPGLARGFFIAGGAALAAGIGVALAGRDWPIVTGVMALVAVYGLGMGSLMLVWSRVIKPRQRETMLDAIAWRGDESVLDVGCGRGLMLVAAAKRLTSGHAIGIDIWQATDQSSNSPAGALANAAIEGVATRIAVQTADMRTLPFADAAFDVIVSHWAVHNLADAADREVALAEMARVARPTGTIILADISNRREYVQTLHRLGFTEQRVMATAWRDALLGLVSFGSFRPGTIVARCAPVQRAVTALVADGDAAMMDKARQKAIAAAIGVSSLGIVLVMATPAAAAPYASRTVAGWTIAASADESGCFLTRDYADRADTTLLLGLDIAGANRLSVLNPDWSIKPKTPVILDFTLSNGRYRQHAAVGIASNGKNGFVTDFEPAFPGHFAMSGFLHIRRGDVPVAELPLDGSGAAVAELRRCVAHYRAQAAGGSPEQQPSTRIPRDPFAPAADKRPRRN